MNETLSHIVADLFDKSKGGEELASKINRLREEIKKVIEGEGTIFGKFRELMESFREIIPEERQRYNAAIKALSTTAKLSKDEIVKAVNNQLEELKIVEKGLIPALPGWRDELKAMEARSQEMKGEIAKLREKIAQLESEEKGVLNSMSAREKEVELVEKAMRDLFTDIGAEITYIKKKVEEFTAETVVAPPIPLKDSTKTAIPSEEKGGGEQKREISEPSAPPDTGLQKKCPMCGGRMDFYLNAGIWQCYSCAYELKKDEVQGESEETSELTNEPEPTPASEQIYPSSPNEKQQPIKEASQYNSQPSTKKKTCPVCHKKMQWYEMDKAWRCPYCDYERRI
jgi:ribosomal protein L37AE/L43A